MNLFRCSRFIFSRRFSFISQRFIPLWFFVAALSFYYHLIGDEKKRREKNIKRQQSNNKAATKNTERLCIALLGFRKGEPLYKVRTKLHSLMTHILMS